MQRLPFDVAAYVVQLGGAIKGSHGTATLESVEGRVPVVPGQTETTPWAIAIERQQNPAPGQNHWIATVTPDGRPHLMPLIAFWIDGAFHFLAGEGTRKGRNFADNDHCVIGTGNLTRRPNRG